MGVVVLVVLNSGFFNSEMMFRVVVPAKGELNCRRMSVS